MEWNFTYENQEASSFLVYQLEKSEQLDTVGMGMLSNNQIPHILPLLYTQIDEERYLRYAIPGRIPLGDYLEEALVLAKQGGFTVMGHLTLPLRYFNEMRGFHTSFDPYEEQERTLRHPGPRAVPGTDPGDPENPDRKRPGHRTELQPGQSAATGREVAENLPGAGRRDHYAGNGRPQHAARWLLRPGAAGTAEKLRLYAVLHL